MSDETSLEIFKSQSRQARAEIARLRTALEKIASNYDEGQTLSGTQCADIASEALRGGHE